MHWSFENGASCPHGAESIRIVGEVDSDILCHYFLAVVPDIEGDVSGWHIGPEFARKAWRVPCVMGMWCSICTSSSTSVHCLSSTNSSSADVYLHSGPFFTWLHRSFFCSLKRSGFLTLSSGSGCIDSSEDVVDKDQTWFTSVCHDVGALWRRRDQERITLALVDGFMAGSAASGVSGAAEVKVTKSA